MSQWFRGLAAAVGLSFRGDPRRTTVFLVLFALRPLSLTFGALFLGRFVDFAQRGDGHGVVLAAAGIALVNVAGFLCGFAGVRLGTRMIEAASHQFERELMYLASGIPGIAQYQDPEFVDRVELLRGERLAVAEGADVVGLQIGVLLRAAMTAVLLALVSPWLLILPVLSVPAMLAGTGAEQRRQRAMAAVAPDVRRARHFFELATTPAAGKELRVFGLRNTLIARHDAILREVDRVGDRAARSGLWRVAAGWGVFAMAHVAALLVVAHGAVSGSLSVGDLVLTLTLIASLTLQLGQTVRFTNAVGRSAAAGGRLVQVREDVRARAITGDRPVPERLARGLELRGVSFAYPGSGQQVLRDVDLVLPAGSVVGIVGDNGAGKSTLVKLLARLYEPSSGEILVDGMPLADMDPQEWRRGLTAGFQDFARLEFMLRESVGVGDLPLLGDESAVLAAVRRGAADEVIADLPRGLDTPLGASMPDGVGLSGGQWQRVALSRALMRPDPLLLLLDEPTAAVDPLTEDALLTRYADAARNVAGTCGGITVIVSHRFAGLRSADLIVVLAEGTVVELGTHADLVSAGGRYAELYELQARSYR